MFPALRQPARLAAALALFGTMALAPSMSTTADAAPRPSSTSPATSDPCGDKIEKREGGVWTCTFADDFSGRSLDTSKWVTGDTSVSGFYANATCFEPGRGYSVGAGYLKLTVSKRGTFDCTTPGGSVPADYIGGAVSTYGKFSQAYGRFEARIKYPSHTGVGLHSGFWMNPQKLTYGVWPASGEIDVAEWFSYAADKAFPSLHYTGRTKADTGWDCAIGAADVFHTYAVEWGPTQMSFLYDGQVCFTRSWMPTDLDAPAPFDKAFVPSLLAAAGGGTNSPDASTPNSATTVVDYVKVWA